MPVIKMRYLLLLPLVLLPAALTIGCLLVLRSDIKREMQEAIEADLQHSAAVYQDFDSDQRTNLQRAASLLAEQPSLKALLTTEDLTTIRTETPQFQKLSGVDLFAFANASEKVISLYLADGGTQSRDAEADLSHIWQTPSPSPYFSLGGKLFEVFESPVYFGSRERGYLLGYVIIGSAVDDRVANRLAQSVSAEVCFVAEKRILGTTLNKEERQSLTASKIDPLLTNYTPRLLTLGGTKYLAQGIPIHPNTSPEIQLVVLKSMEPTLARLARQNRLLLSLGFLALVTGGILAVVFARGLTGPLEELAQATKLVGSGRFEFHLPSSGAVEVRELAKSFQQMSRELRSSQEKLLENERLATIGKMASSISHDLRHYLASVYANAEFLATSELDPLEKAELLAEIQLSVRGTTDLIDSLLLFTRTGRAIHGSYESVTHLAERALSLMRKHPEAALIRLNLQAETSADAWIDTKKIERAIYNLLLNACQASHSCDETGEITIRIGETESEILVRVIDSGPGVPAAIRQSLFDPFVSADKESGVGLGLTIVMTIAREHGGDIVLESSVPGKTVFCMHLNRTIARPQLVQGESGQGVGQ